MRKIMVSLLVSVSTAAFLVSGCANKDAVKKEEAVVPSVTASKQAQSTAQPVQQAKPVEQPKPVEVDALKQAVPQASSTADATVNKFETAYFDFDKSDLRKDTRDVLSKNAEIILKSLATAKIQIEGHCDERGSAEYNMALGERRANSAQKYLTTLGVKGENLSIISYGKEKPAVNGSDEAAWAKNRRAEFVVVK